MPGLDSALAQVIFAFVMIGLFALILRWTFSRDIRERDNDDGGVEYGDLGVAPDSRERPASGADLASVGGPAAATPLAAAPPTGEDFGLLAAAAVVANPQQAQHAREVLRRAGIRATTAVSADGRHRVLVFERELMRARRLLDPPPSR